MAEGIAGVLKSHQLANYSRERYCLCGTFLGDWADEKVTAAHQADALAANGYGKLEDAKADAWDECEVAEYEIRLNPKRNAWEAVKDNPYRRPE